jgi:hypothetical protein
MRFSPCVAITQHMRQAIRLQPNVEQEQLSVVGKITNNVIRSTRNCVLFRWQPWMTF